MSLVYLYIIKILILILAIVLYVLVDKFSVSYCSFSKVLLRELRNMVRAGEMADRAGVPVEGPVP